MTSQTPDMQAVLERLEKLERQHRRLRIGCIACFLAFVSVLTMGEAKAGRTVEAQRFVLRSAKGDIRAQLETIEGEFPRLILQTPDGTKEADLNRLGMSISDHSLPAGKSPIAHYGDVGLYLRDTWGNMVLELGGASTEKPQLAAFPEIKIFDKKASLVWHAP